MEQDVLRQLQWRRRIMPASHNRGAVYCLYQQQYHDQLVKDMGFKVGIVEFEWCTACNTHTHAHTHTHTLNSRRAASTGGTRCGSVLCPTCPRTIRSCSHGSARC